MSKSLYEHFKKQNVHMLARDCEEIRLKHFSRGGGSGVLEVSQNISRKKGVVFAGNANVMKSRNLPGGGQEPHK